MRKRIWVNIAHSFKEAEDFDDKYYFLMSPQERLSDVQFCREIYAKIKNASRRRFRRVIKIIKQK